MYTVHVFWYECHDGAKDDQQYRILRKIMSVYFSLVSQLVLTLTPNSSSLRGQKSFNSWGWKNTSYLRWIFSWFLFHLWLLILELLIKYSLHNFGFETKFLYYNNFFIISFSCGYYTPLKPVSMILYLSKTIFKPWKCIIFTFGLR